jgi:hypothetical protein
MRAARPKPLRVASRSFTEKPLVTPTTFKGYDSGVILEFKSEKNLLYL